MMAVSSVLSGLFTLIGLWLSYLLNLTSGATIILVAAGGFLIASLGERWKRRRPSETSTGSHDHPDKGAKSMKRY
jgi:ABC-type Mn2+/Zn2+ transport system permease subunit